MIIITIIPTSSYFLVTYSSNGNILYIMYEKQEYICIDYLSIVIEISLSIENESCTAMSKQSGINNLAVTTSNR